MKHLPAEFALKKLPMAAVASEVTMAAVASVVTTAPLANEVTMAVDVLRGLQVVWAYEGTTALCMDQFGVRTRRRVVGIAGPRLTAGRRSTFPARQGTPERLSDGLAVRTAFICNQLERTRSRRSACIPIGIPDKKSQISHALDTEMQNK